MNNFLKFLKKIVKFIIILLIIFFLITTLIIIWNKLQTPSNDRDWSEESAILPDITINNNIVNIKNIRDWRYKKGETISRNYYDESFDLQNLEKTWLLFNPFGKWEGVGHFFLVFEFLDGKTISISIEARREASETYASWKGLFNNYEVWYAIGSAADFMTRRVMLYDEDLYIYPLLISSEHSQQFFMDLIKTAENLETEPKFYNTVTSNCTNLLAKSANRIKPKSVPFHYSRLFTGFADDQLYDLGLIPNDKNFDEIYEDARIDIDIRNYFLDDTDYSADIFWEFVSKNIKL